MLLGVRYHDRSISKLMFSEDSGLELEMRHLESGPNSALALRGLHQLNISGFWNTPIVAYIFTWRIGTDTDMRRVPDSAWNALFANQMSSVEGQRAETARITRKWPGALLIHMTFSYGRELAAVCDRLLAHEVE